MRLIGLLIISILLFGFSVAAASLSATSTLLVVEEEASSSVQTFSITVTDTVNNINVDTSSLALSDGDNNITLSFSPSFPISSLTNQTSNIQLTVTTPTNMDIGKYGGLINISGINTTGEPLSTNLDLQILVKPEICEDGVIGNLNLDINEPDNGDDFKPNQELNVGTEVDNNDNDDIDVKVEASLYNMDKGKKILSMFSSEKNIDSDDSETFDMDIRIPTDSKYLKEGEDYMLFVKAYEDGNEEDNCAEEFIDLSLELEEDDVIIESLLLTPQIASCGDTVTASLKARNIGSGDQNNVKLELKQDDLNVNKISDMFDLEEFDDKDGNYRTETFTFNIPDNAEEKDYVFNAKVYFSDVSQSLDVLLNPSASLTVSNCGLTGTTTSTSSQAMLTVSSLKSAAIGSVLSLPYVITNSGQSASFTVEFVPSGTWSTKQTQTVTVGSGQSSQFTISPIINSGISEGSYTATLRLLSGNNVLDQKTISLELLNSNSITGRAIYRKSFFDDLRIDNLSASFWIIANIILALVILGLAYLLLRK